MEQFKVLIQVILVFTIISLNSCKGYSKNNDTLDIVKIEIIEEKGNFKEVFSKEDICEVLQNEMGVSIVFCKTNENEKKIIKNFISPSIIIYTSEKQFLAKPMKVTQAEYPVCDYSFWIDDNGNLKIKNYRIDFYKAPSD